MAGRSSSLNRDWLEIAKRIQAIAQSGLAYAHDAYDAERYEELRGLAVEILGNLSGVAAPRIAAAFASEKGYQTPKVDIRAVVFSDGKVLLVREKIDGRWALPGGWADVGLSPAEVAVKETREESGLDVRVERLLAVFDKKYHGHPASIYHVYKFFFRCEITGGNLQPGPEIREAAFFFPGDLPPLSTERVTAGQIEKMFDFLVRPDQPTIFD